MIDGMTRTVKQLKHDGRSACHPLARCFRRRPAQCALQTRLAYLDARQLLGVAAPATS